MQDVDDDQSHRLAAATRLLDVMTAGPREESPPENAAEEFTRRTNEALTAKYVDQARFRAEMITGYAAEFTVAELEELEAFYSSSVGAHLLRVQPRIAGLAGRRATEGLRTHASEVSAELRRLMDEQQTRD